jgi:dolichol kinase
MMEEEIFVRWYRRAVHAFGASFLVYYLVPSTMNSIKISIVIILISIFGLIEVTRIKKLINLFGIRDYEANRFGSYIYFGIGTAILLIFFPQQIAIPSILCGAYADPAVGEMRRRFGGRRAYLLMFLLSFALFFIVWHSAPFPSFFLIPAIGEVGAMVGEMENFRWIDDDLLIQLIPAILIGIIYVIASSRGLAFLPNPVIEAIGG